ncbi:MAG: hypothetical protein HZB26_26655 [Candidatus Hydrogenedentes bacterium]|nr:hypothetical protein [Candidatus Hydrogenedentota bacterium]
MIHIKRVSVAKADHGEDNGNNAFDPNAILAVLGGTVQQVLLSLTTAKGKGSGTT